MSHLYCQDCGEKIQYSLKKPKFCPSCGSSIGKVEKSSASRGEDTENRDYDLEDKLDSYKMQFDVDFDMGGTIQKRGTLENILKESQGMGEFQRSGKRKESSNVDLASFDKEFLKECGKVTKSRDVGEK